MLLYYILQIDIMFSFFKKPSVKEKYCVLIKENEDKDLSVELSNLTGVRCPDKSTNTTDPKHDDELTKLDDRRRQYGNGH